MNLAGAILQELPSPSGGGQAGGCIAVITDRRLSAAALTALFLRDPQYRLLREAWGTGEIEQLIGTFNPDLTIIDVTWSGDCPPAQLRASNWPGRLLLLLDPAGEPAQLLQSLQIDANGYVSRGASRETLDQAVASLRSSGWYLDPALVPAILVAIRQGVTPVPGGPALSPREDDILVRIASGRSTKEIAREYAIAPKTVSNHVNNIYRKLKLTHRGELVLYAANKGLELSSP